MDNFADFIVNYIENKKIHDIQGWLNQLKAYQWKSASGTQRYSDAVFITKDYWKDSTNILHTPNNDNIWYYHCDKIRKWGGMRTISPDNARAFKKSVIFLMQNDLDGNSDLANCIVCGTRIAMASKIYYFSDPLRWTIYDSRVGYALHQLIFEYAKDRQITPESVFPGNSFCLPDSQTDRRNPVYAVGRCYGSEQRSLWSFLWTSHLHRRIANKLNMMMSYKPDHFLSDQPQWELPHIEMVFFVIGDKKWVDDSGKTHSEVIQKQSLVRGDYAGICPRCGHALKIRQSQITGELYAGCTNYPACTYKGSRSH